MRPGPQEPTCGASEEQRSWVGAIPLRVSQKTFLAPEVSAGNFSAKFSRGFQILCDKDAPLASQRSVFPRSSFLADMVATAFPLKVLHRCLAAIQYPGTRDIPKARCKI